MPNFDAQVRESQSQVAEAQTKIAELTGRIETARAKLKVGDDAMIDIENASLEDVHAHTDVMNANIAELIMGLDDVTSGFSKDFDEMRNKTGWESFVGIFAGAKSDSMRQERVRSASIDDTLQDLISKSDVIVQLLTGQLEMLEDQKVKVESNLTSTLDEREAVVQKGNRKKFLRVCHVKNYKFSKFMCIHSHSLYAGTSNDSVPSLAPLRGKPYIPFDGTE